MSYLEQYVVVTLNELDLITKQLSAVQTLDPKSLHALDQFAADLKKTIIDHELLDLVAAQMNFQVAFEAQHALVLRINNLEEALTFVDGEVDDVVSKLHETRDHLLRLGNDEMWSGRMDFRRRK